LERKKYEEYGYVLDYVPHGRAGSQRQSYRAEPVVQIVGESYFTLLEAAPEPGAVFSPFERIYVGKDRREKISHIIGRIGYEELTSTSRSDLETVIERMVKSQEKRFVEFFNSSQAIAPRMHSLELIPGIGKKIMWTIVESREAKPFENFEDIRKRTGLSDPGKFIAKRILQELRGEERYRIFTRQI